MREPKNIPNIQQRIVTSEHLVFYVLERTAGNKLEIEIRTFIRISFQFHLGIR